MTNGTPTAERGAGDAEEEPAHQERGKRPVSGVPQEDHGGIVAKLISGIMIPPKRSVSAPTGMRPSDPTNTGTATSSAWLNDDS